MAAKPRIFISYARNDDEPFVWKLYRDLVAIETPYRETAEKRA